MPILLVLVGLFSKSHHDGSQSVIYIDSSSDYNKLWPQPLSHTAGGASATTSAD